MYRFHVTLHAAPPDVPAGDRRALGDQVVAPLAIASNELDQPFAMTFEEASAALVELPRMFCEPDGYFVWTGGGGTRDNTADRWQIDGHLFDRSERLLYVLLKGACPAESFDDMLRAFGWPAASLLFQLQDESLVLEEADFRRWAIRRP
jgi:hypothetical protein